MNLRRHRGEYLRGIGLALLLSSAGGDSSATLTRQALVSGTWDAHFSGTVQGTGASQTDELVMDIRQNGSDVTGTLRIQGLDSAFSLSGEVSGTTFRYRVRGTLSPTCEVILEAETTVDAVTSRFGGTQTQSTCEGTAVGKVTAVRR